MSNDAIDFAALLEPVARLLLGEPSAALSTRSELRWGARGSLSVVIAGDKRGSWFDHEANVGGLTLDFLKHQKQLDRPAAMTWLREHHFLSDDPKPNGSRRIVATYDYRDAKGALLFQVCRFDPKDFRQRRPDGNGGWTWKLGDVERVPYRLPELLAAPGSTPVFVCEGERDVDALRELGLTATCNPGGAGKWLAPLSQHLAGRHVVNIADNDQAGERHALDIARQVFGIAETVRIFRPPGVPAKGDVSDWLAADGTKEKLLAFAEDTPQWEPGEDEDGPDRETGPSEEPRPREFGRLRLLTLDDLRAVPPRDYILKRLLSPAEMSVWWGPPKCGKSFLAFYIGYAVAQGRSIFGRRVKARTVLYVAAEGTAGLAGRLHALEREFGPAPRFYLIAQSVDLLHPFGDLPSLLKAAKTIKAGLIVLDTLNRMLSGGDENGSEDMGALIRNAGVIQAETPAHVAIVHHGTKSLNGSTPRGHSSLIGAADLVVEVAKTDDRRRTATVRAAKDEAEGDIIGFRLKVVELGTDPDGDPITTCLAEEAEPAAARPGFSATEAKARSILADLIAVEGAPLPPGAGFPDNARGVPEPRWRDECETRRLSTSEQRDSRTKAFNRAFKGLIAANAVATRDNLVWLVRPEAPEEG